MRHDRLIKWLVRFIPEPIMAAPERVLINFACVLIGIGGLAGARPGSLLALWPRWVSLEWSVAMLIGGACALTGFWLGKRPLARLGYMLIGVASAVYAIGLAVVFGLQGLAPVLIFLGLAIAKFVRLVVGSAVRASIIEAGRDRDRP
jgi:hypothetical protein